jgi:hypothetical protein
MLGSCSWKPGLDVFGKVTPMAYFMSPARDQQLFPGQILYQVLSTCSISCGLHLATIDIGERLVFELVVPL